MRLIFALFYIGFGIWLYLKLGGDNLHAFLGMAVGFGLLFSSVIVCNKGFVRKLRGISDQEYIASLIEKGNAIVEGYTCHNAIYIEDLRTGCDIYLLDVGSNQTLCLNGQWYLFEPISEPSDPEFDQDRKFPTKQFSIVLKNKRREVLDITIGIEVFEPIIVDYKKIPVLHDFGFKLEDGELISNIDFNKIITSVKE